LRPKRLGWLYGNLGNGSSGTLGYTASQTS
jgi:hypothetical protein